MKKVLVLYYSRTGNTEKMAKAVAEGSQINGVEVELNYHVDAENLSSYDAILVGTPTYNHDMPVDFKNLFEESAVAGIKFEGQDRCGVWFLRLERRSAKIDFGDYEV